MNGSILADASGLLHPVDQEQAVTIDMSLLHYSERMTQDEQALWSELWTHHIGKELPTAKTLSWHPALDTRRNGCCALGAGAAEETAVRPLTSPKKSSLDVSEEVSLRLKSSS